MGIVKMPDAVKKRIVIFQELVQMDLKSLAAASHMLEDVPPQSVLNHSRIETLLYLSNDLIKNLVAIDELYQLVLSFPEEDPNA